ncbi:MAG TPA: sterol desaturase family protein [Acidimicrobiales bacterium]|jgi:sterol desaturase/sphingolipid hydroxylase (fatty acid hydroxylase superfamily)
MRRERTGPRDLTVVAVPFYFASMAAEYAWLRRRAARRGPSAGDYELRDTVASLAMGVGSLLAPLVLPRMLRPFTPGRGRYGRALLATAVGAVAVTAAADFVARTAKVNEPLSDDVRTGRLGPLDPAGEVVPGAGRTRRAAIERRARRIASVGGVTAVVAGGVAVTTTWASRTTADRFWRHRLLPSLGTGPLAMGFAIAGWDFIYYWNHRLMHESRYMWALHVVHHSSEHYNLSTALRQPVADVLGTTLPYGALCLTGIAPELITTARGVNLLYQFWIHTETIGRLGPAETALNTPSHHRVHHGSNGRYLDRNHGSILIIWDRLFGTFEPEDERVVYGLTKNINTFNAGRIISHEYAAMLRDVAGSSGWGERLSYVFRGPGWATRHRAELDAAAGARGDRATVAASGPAVALAGA